MCSMSSLLKVLLCSVILSSGEHSSILHGQLIMYIIFFVLQVMKLFMFLVSLVTGFISVQFKISTISTLKIFSLSPGTVLNLTVACRTI